MPVASAAAAAPPYHIENVVPASISGSLTQTSDSPAVSHASISWGMTLPSASEKRRSEPSAAQAA